MCIGSYEGFHLSQTASSFFEALKNSFLWRLGLPLEMMFLQPRMKREYTTPHAIASTLAASMILVVVLLRLQVQECHQSGKQVVLGS